MNRAPAVLSTMVGALALGVLVSRCGGGDSNSNDSGPDTGNANDGGLDSSSDCCIPNPNAGKFNQVDAGFIVAAVSGTSASDVWACAGNGIAHWDGTSWSAVTSLSTSAGCVDIWAGPESAADGGDDLWMVGWNGLGTPWVGKRKGGVLTTPTVLADGGKFNMVNVEATDIDHVWVSSVTYPGTAPSDIWNYDGNSLFMNSPRDGGNSAFGYAVEPFASNDVWAAADILAHQTDGGWTNVEGFSGGLRVAIAGTSNNDLYVGYQTSIVHYDGQNWNPVTITMGGDGGALAGIWVEDATQSQGITFFAARLQTGSSSMPDQAGVIALSGGKGVATPVTPKGNNIPRKIWASSATDVWMTDLSAGQLYRGSPYLPN